MASDSLTTIESHSGPPVLDIESDSISNLRTTKRKLDDAFRNLDSAVRTPEIQPPPPKRSHTIRSLYSTLAKYGIKTKESPPNSTKQDTPLPASPSTPHLTAILTRAANRTRKALPFKFSSHFTKKAPPLPPTAGYRPSSLPAFLLRLSTFKLATYANKAPVIDAVAASRCGWVNEGKDRLVCGLCKSSWVAANRDGMSKDAAKALLEKQRASLIDMHKDGCPWKARQCDPTIYRIPLKSPANMVEDIKTNAIALDSILQNIETKHPLTSTQLSSLLSTLSTFELPSQSPQPDVNNQQSQPDDHDVFMSGTSMTEPSSTAILTSLFGWSLAPIAPAETTRRTSLSRTSLTPFATCSPSNSRASSVQPASSVPSVQYGTPMTPTRVPNALFTFRVPSNVNFKHHTTLLQCALCQRRVGLWAFAPQLPSSAAEPPNAPGPLESADPGIMMDAMAESPNLPTPVPAAPPKKSPTQRPFDLLKEHRSYCPYVVRSTVVPTLPVPSALGVTTSANTHNKFNSTASQVNGQNGNSALEGWRAVLTVILRYGVGHRQRLGLDFVERLRGEAPTQETSEVDGVKAMMDGVKSRGGKDLLKYVKALLG